MVLNTSKKNWVKKLAQPLVFAAGFATATVAVADNGGFLPGGFYAGLSGGVMQARAKIAASPSATFTNYYDDENQISSSQEAHIWKDTGIGAIYLGYRQPVNNSNFFMAGEIFSNIAKHKVTLNNFVYHQQPNDDEDFESITTATQAKLNDAEFGVDIQPAYLFDSHTVFYGRLGAAFNRLTVRSNSNFSFTYLGSDFQETAPPPVLPLDPPINFNSPLALSKAKDVVGLRLGLGIEHNLSDNIAITADYIYTNYGKVNTAGIADAQGIVEDNGIYYSLLPATTTGGLTSRASARLATQTLMLGLKYTFPAV